ncbi:MAG: protein translocase subunit SecF [Ruminococcus sp.]|nr:protein translocase subunit SecF [Ruminococcus sp.]
MSKNKNINTPVETAKVRDFCSKTKMIAIIAAVLVTVTIIGTIIRGLNVAIEFKGGTLITYQYTGDIDVNEAKNAISSIVTVPINVRSGESLESDAKELIISFTSEEGLTADKQTELTDALQAKFKDNAIELYDSNDVNPTTGSEFLLKCVVAVIFAAILIILYIAVRFRKIGGWTAGLCSVLALLHDLCAAFAANVLFGFEFNSNTVAVILTILGYSINNTIVIYDRIRENKTLMPKASLKEIINAGCSQSLTRSIRTSITTVGTMVALTIVVIISGYTSLLTFSVPLMVGLISGAYSSLFVAPVTWYAWETKRAAKGKAKKN